MNRPSVLLVVLLFLCVSSCGPKAEPSSGDAWTQLSSMPTARSENAAVVIGQTIYVPGGFGGEQKLEAYDTATDTWATLADPPVPPIT